MTNWRKVAKHLPLGKPGYAKAELMDIFPNVFKGMGTILGEYSIGLNKDAKSVHLPARNMPEVLC